MLNDILAKTKDKSLAWVGSEDGDIGIYQTHYKHHTLYISRYDGGYVFTIDYGYAHTVICVYNKLIQSDFNIEQSSLVDGLKNEYLKELYNATH